MGVMSVIPFFFDAEEHVCEARLEFGAFSVPGRMPGYLRLRCCRRKAEVSLGKNALTASVFHGAGSLASATWWYSILEAVALTYGVAATSKRAKEMCRPGCDHSS